MTPYNKYKPSGIEWIGEIPEHWVQKRLKYIGYLYGGLSGKSGSDFNQELSDKSKPFIPFTNICNNKAIDPNQMQYVVIEEDEKQNVVAKGDLFFMMSSENYEDVGKSSILLDDIGETYLNSFCKGFRFTHKNYHPPFINYLLLSKPYRSLVLTEANGFTRINLKMDKINNIPLVVPPTLQEQTAIVNYLDQETSKIDSLIEYKQQLIELYEEEKTGIINQTVTKGINPQAKLKDSGIEWLGQVPEHWEEKRFKYFFSLIKEKFENNLPKIGLENIESKTGRYLETDSDFDGQGIVFKPKDILFGKLRPYLAKVWLANREGQAVGDFYVFRSKSTVYPEYAKYRLLDASFIEVTNSSTYGSKMPRVSWDFIADLPIAFPQDIDEQKSIVNHIEAQCAIVDSKIAIGHRQIKLYQEYKQALISEVVTGRVKVV